MSVKILIGDVLQRIGELADHSVDCCVTSPPYWGLRDYGVAGQLGLEKTPQEHIAALVKVFREVKRVLKPEGTLWVNYGDMYASSVNGRPAAKVVNDNRTFRDKPFSTVGHGFKPKDLIMMSAMLALALQSDGWYLRNEIIWHKPNAMPESVKDRCAVCHEKIYLFSQSPRYYFDYKSAKENAVNGDPTPPRGSKGNKFFNKGLRKSFRGGGAYTNNRAFNNSADVKNESVGNKPNKLLKRLRRTVWTIPTKGFPEAHFATFPPELVRPCIVAGCPAGGMVFDPFGGAGTTALVAAQEQRNSILIELNPAYAEISRKRILQDGGLFTDCEVV